MTTRDKDSSPDLAPVRALIEKWRAHIGCDDWHVFYRAALDDCADELEAALSVLQKSEEKQ